MRQPKYNVGDVIVATQQKSKEVICPVCGGEKRLGKDKKVDCPYCYGEGMITDYKVKEDYEVSGKITRIGIYKTSEKTEVVYIVDYNYSTPIKEEEIKEEESWIDGHQLGYEKGYEEGLRIGREEK